MEEGTSPKLSNISDVEIDENGRFKYILIKVIDDTQGNVYKYIVRGFAWASYHGRFLCASGSSPFRCMFDSSLYIALMTLLESFPSTTGLQPFAKHLKHFCRKYCADKNRFR